MYYSNYSALVVQSAHAIRNPYSEHNDNAGGATRRGEQECLTLAHALKLKLRHAIARHGTARRCTCSCVAWRDEHSAGLRLAVWRESGNQKETCQLLSSPLLFYSRLASQIRRIDKERRWRGLLRDGPGLKKTSRKRGQSREERQGISHICFWSVFINNLIISFFPKYSTFWKKNLNSNVFFDKHLSIW